MTVYPPMVLHKYFTVLTCGQSSPMGIGVEHYGVVLGVYLVGGWYWGIPSFEVLEEYDVEVPDGAMSVPQ